MPQSLSYLALLAFCSFASLHIPLAGMLWFYLNKTLKLSQIQSLFLLPALSWVIESIYPMIFNWHLGYTWLWASFPAFHLAEIFGFKGLSLLTYFANFLLMLAAYATGRKRWILVGSTVAGFALLNLGGHLLKQRLPEYDDSKSALIVQANIGNLEKQYAYKGLGFRDSILDQYIGLTQKGLSENPNVDFAIWPETAFPDELNRPGYASRHVLRLRGFLNEAKLNLVTGSYGQKADTRQTTNSMFFLYPADSGAEPKEYDKTELLAFGEYIPGSIYFPVLKKWLPQVADFARGQGPSVKDYVGLRVGPQICYEGLFDWFTRESAQLDAQMILNVTNDSWYGTWQEPYQHLYMTLARAIEIRRPLIRATNTGISTVVLADGKILEQSPLETVWQGRYEIPLWKNGPVTLFTTWGYWLPLGFCLLWIIGCVYKFRKPPLDKDIE